MDNGTGRLGENHIAKLLESKGYHILKRNYHSRFGEIDIIAESDNYIVFVEVKTRKKDSMVAPFEAITPAKCQKIILTAGQYLADNTVTKQPRFDAAAVYTDKGVVIGEEYLENAFINAEL